MDDLTKLGISPFQVFDSVPPAVSDRSFRSQQGDFELKVCLQNMAI